jgi:hypothetical protein
MTVADELRTTQRRVSQVERLEGVASRLSAVDRQAVQEVIDELISDAPAVRPPVAAQILQLSEKTVRAWQAENVLVAVQAKPRLTLRFDRLHEVLHLVRDLREAGRTAGLLDEVYRRLSDAHWQDNADLAESLAAMQRGEKIPALLPG